MAKSSGASVAQMPAKSLKSFAPVEKSSGALSDEIRHKKAPEPVRLEESAPLAFVEIFYSKNFTPLARTCQYPRHRCLKMSVGQEPPHTIFLTQRTAPVNGLPFGPLALRPFTVAELA